MQRPNWESINQTLNSVELFEKLALVGQLHSGRLLSPSDWWQTECTAVVCVTQARVILASGYAGVMRWSPLLKCNCEGL